MQEDAEKTRPSTPSGGQFIDTLIGQWMKRTGIDIVVPQAKEQVTENASSQERKQVSQNYERNIHFLQRKLKQSQRAEIFLTSSLEAEMRNKEDIQTKLNATWESIETIRAYFNFISESLESFQQHRVNLSNLYDNVILKQQESIQMLQSSNAKLTDLESHIARLENESLLQEKRLQEATTEENKLRKQLEDSVYELQSQKNALTQTHEEKLKLIKEQQRLSFEYENLQLRLQTVENEKCDIAKSATQLQNKLLLQEEKTQAALAEQNKLQRQLENANNEFFVQQNSLASAHAEEKKKIVEEQQRFLTECEVLQSQLNTLEQDKSNIVDTVAQKDELILKLRDENSEFKNQIEAITASNEEAFSKYKALKEKQDMGEKELKTKTERIQNLEVVLSAMKQRETSLVNDINRMEKKLTNEMGCIKNLESKLADTRKDLHIAEMQNAEMQEALKSAKIGDDLANVELQKTLKIFEREKEEAAKRESTWTKNAEIMYEKTRVKHAEEVSALTSGYETRLLELRKTIDHLNETSNNIIKENSVLKTSLTEIRGENITLRSDYQFATERNNDLQDKLKEATEKLQTKSTMDNQESKKSVMKDKKRSKAKGDYTVRFDPDIVAEIPDQCNQEEEVTSAGRKFFKSRPAQPRTYSRRRLIS
ncbi:PREDICTED: synaptonemal complex protein 1-like isoform X2 [Dinoponera quadriceps]|uniref:Synaptonemal complex protein 1-like isoform X2 n=1 Tax=Dinoponera quadriceps TaxID=609295 RepID=A0A6P3XYZ9_DINQU|nr:PREDICTED: synaptonemal complex protein 1-like isoform X2 [Dinoponera quadriceps]